MLVEQITIKEGQNLQEFDISLQPDLILYFGQREMLDGLDIARIQSKFTNMPIVGCSAAGVITDCDISDHCIVFNFIKLDKSEVRCHVVNILDYHDSQNAGEDLINKFDPVGLKYLLVLSDGQLVNGSDLLKGINKYKPKKVPVSGGLAGDGERFEKTLVGLNDDLRYGNILAIGFYGDNIRMGFGSNGGWEEFGLTREVTKSEKNILFEIDNENALDLYKKYLGTYAEELPGAALLFPLAIQASDQSSEVVRTILSIDENNKSMTFAGNIPIGSKVRLMKANLDNLIDAAASAMKSSTEFDSIPENQKLSILISCVGRKLIFKERIDEEHEVAKDVLGNHALITGFYSYGEISPFDNFTTCELHNQTMTVTTIAEL